jgi:UDP:flavonoid glycosyltransferase YjiC (YdhE family)
MRANVRAFSHIPLSRVVSHASLLVHHCGIGSMYAGLLAGVPALAVPHAFDQGFNLDLLEHLGVGQHLGADPMQWSDQVSDWVFDDEKHDSAKTLAARLRSPEAAASELASRLLLEAG